MEAVETLFTPLCVYNNTSGDRDDETREAYQERSWNNPVVRVVDRRRNDLTKGLTRRWTVAGIADLMARACLADEREVPAWLSLLATTSDVPKNVVETAIFGMS